LSQLLPEGKSITDSHQYCTFNQEVDALFEVCSVAFGGDDATLGLA